MASDDNQQYFITILNANGETINITPEILPEQLLPLVQKKQLKEEKVDLSNLPSAYKKIFENLSENSITSLGSIPSLNNILNVNSSNNNSRIKLSSSNNSDQNKNSTSSSSLITNRSPLQTILLRSSNQNSHSIQPSVPNEHILPGSITDNSNNYITTLQISQSNSNLQTLAFTQPQALLQYSNQNPDSPNTVLIPISLHNNNQFSQQQILVAAAAVASGGYNQNCSDNSSQQAALTSNSLSHHSLNTTSLAKLISGNVTNPLSINLGHMIKSNSANSDISPDSKSSTNNKRKFDSNTTDEFGRRKEMRLLKNREAARECRRKKKEYVKCLENRVTNLEQQNKVLVDEINRMKELYGKKMSKKPPGSTTAMAVTGSDIEGQYYDQMAATVTNSGITTIATSEHQPSNERTTLTPIGNIANQPLKDRDSAKKEATNSQLSALLVAGAAKFSSPNFQAPPPPPHQHHQPHNRPPSSTHLPSMYHRGSHSKDDNGDEDADDDDDGDDDSNSPPCDLN